MVDPHRPQSARTSMRPPPRPTGQSVSVTGRSQSPAESTSSGSTSWLKSPNAQSQVGSKRKERDYEQDPGEETSIHVVVRCRGRSDREVRENSGVVVSTNGVKGKNVELSMGPNAISNKTYHFDKVFSPAADQAIIFDDVVTPILGEMLAGYNCTIFAYGQTGTGKTYTMSGDMTDTLGLLSDAAGIIPRVLYSLFQKLETDELECSVKCSFIELYNEELRDLLAADDSVKLKIYDDTSKKGHCTTIVQGMEESHIKSARSGIKLLQEGSHRRQVAATKCNDLSSRSHTVFTITAYVKKTSESGEDFICAGKLNLVDLAGSENIQRSGAENKRAAEAGLINKSLLTLGRVINALVDKSSHIPYRESKLTRLLQDSLGGRTKTCIIATVSPAKSNLEETISTLDYAFRAKNIRNKPQVNSMISKKTLLREFTAEIEKLKGELIATRQRNGVYLSNEQYEEITVESESRRILSEEQRARIEAMEVSLRSKVQELFSLTSNFNVLKKDNEAIRTALENAKDVLQKTELVLRDTRLDLAEETKVRMAHQSTEKELHKLGTGLISTLNETVNDLGSLHSKLHRRSDLHAVNRKTWESSTSKVLSVSQLIDMQVECFQTEQSRLMTALSSRVDQFVSIELQKLEDHQKNLKTSAEEYSSSEEQVNQQTSQARDDMNTVLEEIKVLREEVKAKVGDGLNGLSAAAARISKEVMSELDQFHTQLYTSYSTLGRDFKSMFEDITKHLHSQKDEAENLRRQLQDANRNNIDASRAVSSQIEAFKERERDLLQQDRQALLAQMTAIIEESATKQDQRLASGLNSTQSYLSGSCTTFELADKTYGEGMDLWLENDKALIMQVTKSKDSLKAKMKKDWTDINTRNTSIQSSTKTIHEETVRIVDAQLTEMTVQMAALDEFVTRARAQNELHHTSHTQSLKSISSSVHQTLERIGENLKNNAQANQSFQRDIETNAANLQNTLPKLVDDLRQPMSELRSQIQGASLSEYAPTGDTPQKREWSYPSTLPRTLDPEPPVADLRELPPPEDNAAKPARTLGWSPRKGASPRKIASSPTKLSSPAKSIIYNDLKSSSPSSRESQPLMTFQGDIPKAGLKEVDINTIPRPSSADDANHVGLSFPRSTNNPAQPPLKRHATGMEGSRLPMKFGGGKGKGVAVMDGRENANVLSQSVGVVGSGRRLRSSQE